MDMQTELYLSDLRQWPVRYGEAENGNFTVQGLPLLKPGTYHGVEFTQQHLADIAANHERSAEDLAFQPPIRPFHVEPGGRVNARTDILGNITRAYVQDGVLLGDAVVYDADTIQQMQKGRFRYTSSEVRLKPGAADGTAHLIGAAWVDDPAVKGLPWALVMNREEYAGIEAAGDAERQPEHDTEGGHKPMSLRDKVLGALGLLNEAVAEDVALGANAAQAATPQAAAETPPADTPEVIALREQVATMQAERDAAQAAAAQVAAAAVASAVDGHITALLSERYIVPAQQDGLRALMLALGAAEQTVMLSADAEPVNLLDALVANLRAGQQIDARYFSQMSTPPPDQAETLEAAAARIIAAG